MRDDDGRKLDHKTLEAVRIRAVAAVKSGARPEDVAKNLGMTRSAVYGWVALAREGGTEALRAKPVPGRPPKLSGPQMRRVYELVVGNDPRQLSFDFALWTRDLVRLVIMREFGVSLSVVSVGRLLRTLGLSPQRPLWRAWQQSPDAVARWKTEQFPAIRAQAAAEGATVYFADEAGVRSDYHAGTTWGRVGHTPIVKTTGARHSVNLVSAVTAQGALRFAAYEGSFVAATFIDFCKRLLRDATGPVFLVVDGHPTHKAKVVKQFVADTNAISPADAASLTMLRTGVEELLETLTPRERRVLQHRFGLLNGQEMTLEELGKRFGASRERIRQIEARGLRKLRHPSRQSKLRDFLS